MPVTIADVVALDVVARGEPEVLSDCRWADEIRWVHVGDVADLSSLLRGGELLLTTGAPLRRAPKPYLRGLADAGALGVVVELGASLRSVPASVAATARDMNLALVVLHRPIKFVEVTETVHRRIVAEQYDEVAFDRRVHEVFTELSMKRASVPGIVDAAARMLDEPVVLEDLTHQALAVSASGRAAAALLDDWERRSRMVPPGGDEQWVVTSVGPRAEEWGRLIVPRRPADAARARRVLERASAALALHRMIERDRSGLHQQAQSGLIDDIVRGRITDDAEAAARAHALGLRKAARYLPVTVRVDRTSDDTDPVAAQRRNVELLDTVAHTVNAAGHTALFAIRRDGEIGAVLSLGAGRGGTEEKALTALGDVVGQRIRQAHGVAAVVAVGPPGGDVVDAVGGLAEAAHVAEVAIGMGSSTHGRSYFRASDVRLRGLLSLLREDPRVQSFAETELRALLTSPDTAQPSNLTVLREFLTAAGNKAALAQRLHISRPSLYKRLAAIERTLGVDLDDAESMTSLHVALLVHDGRRAAPSVTG
ncbi:PucR family transcriptional regulator [Mycolicibacterium sp. GCM10028919]|uniref:PucR family transcriptional regulator n=1 Tax=Mycolicibacterium sp. GCM10028919 TaxID=3273401 RepID=UPI0036217AC9